MNHKKCQTTGMTRGPSWTGRAAGHAEQSRFFFYIVNDIINKSRFGFDRENGRPDEQHGRPAGQAVRPDELQGGIS